MTVSEQLRAAKALTGAQKDMLKAICFAAKSGRIGARGVGQFTPYDLGGCDGSNTSAILSQLARKGLVDQKWLGLDWNQTPSPNRSIRGSKCYRANDFGFAVLAMQMRKGGENEQAEYLYWLCDCQCHCTGD